MTADTILEWVYWYPPVSSPALVFNLTTDDLGMVNMYVINASLVVGNLVLGGQLAQKVLIKVTPEGFVNWYNNNVGAINALPDPSAFQNFYRNMNSPINGYTNYQAATTAYVSARNLYWIPLASAVNNPQYNASNAPLPQGLPGFNLYALVAPANNTQAAVTTLGGTSTIKDGSATVTLVGGTTTKITGISTQSSQDQIAAIQSITSQGDQNVIKQGNTTIAKSTPEAILIQDLQAAETGIADWFAQNEKALLIAGGVIVVGISLLALILDR